MSLNGASRYVVIVLPTNKKNFEVIGVLAESEREAIRLAKENAEFEGELVSFSCFKLGNIRVEKVFLRKDE